MREVRTKSGFVIANNYTRIVHGGRGDYVEMLPKHMVKDNIKRALMEVWRIDSPKAYYEEFRTADICNLKIYYQKKLVSYADYKIGMFYVAYKDVVIPSEGMLNFLG